ncbi:unnamed protein product [Clavelina lepadiformis]|uniref:Phosphoenolpyruvate synthase n=2 Tax=Clavelina lepadiformis TaxID=159417 RepID=A0ABP0FI48_CLALP
MFFELVALILLVIFLKAFWDFNSNPHDGNHYNHPGVLFGLKKFLTRAFLQSYETWTKRKALQPLNDLIHILHEENVVEMSSNSDGHVVISFDGLMENGSDVTQSTVLSLKLIMRSKSQTDLVLYLQVPEHGFLQLPNHPDTVTCYSSGNDRFHAEGVSLEMLEPMQRWRISYRGLMRMVDTNKDPSRWSDGKSLVFVKFRFLWTSYSTPHYFVSDADVRLLSDAIAREPWGVDFWRKTKRFYESNHSYEQWGQMRGNLYIDGMEEGVAGRDIYIRGTKFLSCGSDHLSFYRRYLRIRARSNNGVDLSLEVVNTNNSLTHAVAGYVISDRRTHSITWLDLCLWEHGENEEIPDVIQFNVGTDQGNYNVVCLIKTRPIHYHGVDWKGKSHTCLSDVYIDSRPGTGFVEFYYSTPNAVCPIERPIQTTLLVPQTYVDSKNRLIASLMGEEAKNKLLVGKKACYLAFTNFFLAESTLPECYVPNGFCVTANAYKLHLQENPYLRKMIDHLQDVLSNEDKEEVFDVSKKCYAAFTNSILSSSLVSQIQEHFFKLKKQRNSKIIVAVRFSSVEEYDENLSSPASVGVSCMNQVLSAILKCWAFQFSYEALLHRRKHGLPYVSEMSVIIQLMVEQERIAGVLHTSEPNTGDPLQSVIEVYSDNKKKSEKCESLTDRYVLRKHNNESYVVVAHTSNKPTQASNHAIKNSLLRFPKHQRCCLSYDDLAKLSKVAEALKTSFQSDLKIKWSLSSTSDVYILQAKPLVIDPPESDDELLHEFDTAKMDDHNHTVTFEQMGICPEMPTPLTFSTLYRAVIDGLQSSDKELRNIKSFDLHDVALNIFEGRVYVNTQDISMLRYDDLFRVDSQSMQTFDEQPTMTSTSFYSRLRSIFRRTMVVFNAFRKNSEQELLEFTETVEKIDVTSGTSIELHEKISEEILPALTKPILMHVQCATRLNFIRKLVEAILRASGTDQPTSHDVDVLMLMGDVDDDEDENIPCLLQRLVTALKDQKDEFQALKPLKATDWLQSDANEKVQELYQEFMTKYGHRSLEETELRELSWSQDTTKIITAIKALLENDCMLEQDNAKKESIDTTEKLKLPQIHCHLLKTLLAKARQAISLCRRLRSLYMRNVTVFKRGYWHLATQLKREMKLPDEDLMYFLTHREVMKLIKNYSPKLVAKSINRRHLYFRHQNSCSEDTNTSSMSSSTGSLEYRDCVCTGMTVFPKKVRGPARVLTDITDAFLIQAGEILIVRSPDVGWTPFYPVIAGIVCEVGDIMSCGASIAQEWGVACIIQAKNATRNFTTGEMVVLDGDKSTIRPASTADR